MWTPSTNRVYKKCNTYRLAKFTEYQIFKKKSQLCKTTFRWRVSVPQKNEQDGQMFFALSTTSEWLYNYIFRSVSCSNTNTRLLMTHFIHLSTLLYGCVTVLLCVVVLHTVEWLFGFNMSSYVAEMTNNRSDSDRLKWINWTDSFHVLNSVNMSRTKSRVDALISRCTSTPKMIGQGGRKHPTPTLTLSLEIEMPSFTRKLRFHAILMIFPSESSMKTLLCNIWVFLSSWIVSFAIHVL